MKKRIVVLGAASSVVLASIVSLGMARAATQTSGKPNLVNRIAQTFHLNAADVQKVFDEERATHEAQRQAAYQARIDQAVKDGTLTQSQADALKAKEQELQTFRDSLKDKTPTERRTAMQSKIQEYQAWLTQQNIPAQFSMMGRGHHMGMGPNMSPGEPATEQQ